MCRLGSDGLKYPGRFVATFTESAIRFSRQSRRFYAASKQMRKYTESRERKFAALRSAATS